MKNNYKLFTLKEQVFLLFSTFFTIICLITAIFSNGTILWLFIATLLLLVSVLSYKNIYIKAIHKLEVYIFALLLLQVFWVVDIYNFMPNSAYTILILLFINFATAKRERIILNIIIFISLLTIFLTFYERADLLQWCITLPILMCFILIITKTSENSHRLEKSHNTQREQQLLELSIKDHLTGLYNRNYMEQKLKTTHSIWKRGIQTYSLIMIDIDFFKNYNDHYGHIQGDNCLKSISGILKQQLTRDTDYAFRYGGEEFLVILGFTDKEGAQVIAEKIKEAIVRAKIPHANSDVSPYLTISMGVATIDNSYDSFAELLLRTDKALYLAKGHGRNRIEQYE